MLEVAACLEEGPVLRAVPKGRVNPPPDHRQDDSRFDSNVHISSITSTTNRMGQLARLDIWCFVTLI